MSTDTTHPASRLAFHPAPRAPFHATLGPAVRGPVLLACDGAAPTDAAALTARHVARRLATTIDVVAVLEPLPVYGPPDFVPYVPPRFEAERRADLQAAVGRRLEPVLGSREGWRTQIEYGPIGRTIAETAEVRDAGLIVLGTGGHRLRDRLLGEDVALQTVRHARCPVLSVVPEFAGRISRVVVGVDFGAPGVRAALAAAALLDPEPGVTGRLLLVHVRSPFEHEYPILGTWASAFDANVATRMMHLRTMLRAHVGDDVMIETRSRVGSVVATLLDTADEVDADVIAVGTHGPGWLERLFVGSVASDTVRRAQRSVLVAPPPAAIDRVRLELGISERIELTCPDDWAAALDAFTRRNAGRPARLDVRDTSWRARQVETVDYPLRGTTYDHVDRRVTISLGDEGIDARHLTHAIPGVRSVEILARPDGLKDALLVIRDAAGDCVLSFLDDDAPSTTS